MEVVSFPLPLFIHLEAALMTPVDAPNQGATAPLTLVEDPRAHAVVGIPAKDDGSAAVALGQPSCTRRRVAGESHRHARTGEHDVAVPRLAPDRRLDELQHWDGGVGPLFLSPHCSDIEWSPCVFANDVTVIHR